MTRTISRASSPPRTPAAPTRAPRPNSGPAASLAGRSAEQIFGGLDAQKLRSSMTLFHRAAPEEPVFGQVLAQYFDGQADPATDRLL